MKNIYLMLSALVVLFASCQKETVKPKEETPSNQFVLNGTTYTSVSARFRIMNPMFVELRDSAMSADKQKAAIVETVFYGGATRPADGNYILASDSVGFASPKSTQIILSILEVDLTAKRVNYYHVSNPGGTTATLSGASSKMVVKHEKQNLFYNSYTTT
ncbi:hypothetical protein [Mucilaginibacter pedocola]|uniref:Uncharacterized protein n=1 Tax=Mucilaginibacter pedocola TaxID=1792845 RepID=A0A1S9PL60_9SPHI|nr:hypothetical protein [Mucilaginibacter pedocola]OOQ61706.1 hypothetical protein BC343_01125 [Mucilaginibacter pedocola]